MSSCYCNKLRDNRMKYDYIYAPINKIPNECLHNPEIDERHMSNFINCVEKSTLEYCNNNNLIFYEI